MPNLHENRRKRVRISSLLVAGCLLFFACSSRSTRVEHAPSSAPPPEATVEAETVTTADTDYPTEAELAAEPAFDEPAVDPLADADLPAQEAPVDPDDWEAMTPEERATRLHFEGLGSEANRFAAEFLGPEGTGETAEEPTLLEELTETPIPEDYSIPENREEILRRTESDLPLVLNAQVIKLINYFSRGRGRATYRSTMGRGAAYRDMIYRILEEEGVPKEFFHLAQAESGFLPKARSWARATGMWQFVSYRGRQYGLRQNRYVEERYDVEKSARASARHLKDLYIEFGDWYLAMAAYNGGPGRVRRAIERSGSRDYWTLCEKRLLRRETRNYVPIILAFTYLTKNQGLYDLGEIDAAPPLRYDTVTTNSEISVELVADLTDSTATTIQQLNPALLRSATPPFDYALRLPEGKAEEFRREIAAVPEDKRLDWRRPVVEEGDTLAILAKRHGVKESEIASLNELDGETLTAGMRLNIPTDTRLRLYGGWGRAGGFVEGGTGRYRIASGDTLGAIAARFGVSVRQLMAWNGLPNTRIRAGRYLNIESPDGSGRPARSSSRASNAGPAPSGSYKVRRGDSLSTIAARHGVSVRQLMAWNGLRGSRINIGQNLRVPGGASSSGGTETAPSGGEYRIRNGDNLATIASRFGVTVNDLQSWNGMRGTRIRAGDTLRVAPAGASAPSSSQSAATAVEARAVSSSSNAQRYRIRSGDNLATIAQRHNVTVAQLKAWNGLRSSRITAGKHLTIHSPAGRAGNGSASARSTSSASSSPRSAQASGANVDRYRVRRGDNLVEIARRYDVSVEDLQRWNNLNGSRITAGEHLTIRTNAKSPAGQYRIRRGDTLEDIAKRFGVTVEQLKIWNGLRNSRIHEGRYLSVSPSASQNQSGRMASAGGS